MHLSILHSNSLTNHCSLLRATWHLLKKLEKLLTLIQSKERFQ
uniref:Uncharacterized protein n=1 Tax=Populus trichocarpa TaxID=3694 RepID=A0A3N7G631_POPTR